MDATTSRIVREELWRSIAWAGLGLVGWSIVITESSRVPATALTALGLPVLTWAFLTTTMIGIRLGTGLELQYRSKEAVYLSFALGTIVAGFGAVYLVTARGYSAALVGSVYVAVTAGGTLWFRYVGYPDETNGTAS